MASNPLYCVHPVLRAHGHYIRPRAPAEVEHTAMAAKVIGRGQRVRGGG
jgi:hypothetical protein